MPNHTPSVTRHSGIDKDGLNLPSFRDLVSFRGAVARSNITDVTFSTRGHEEANVLTTMPRRHAEEPFEVVGVQRASHHADDTPATQHLPHRDRQQLRSDRVLHQQRPSNLTSNQREDVLPSSRSRDGEHYYARNFDVRSDRPHAERMCEGFERLSQDRVEPHAFSNSKPPRREIAPTSHEMVRTTERYQPIAPYPSNGRSTRVEVSNAPDMSPFVEWARRQSQAQIVKPPAPRSDMRWPRPIQDDRRHQPLDGQVSERHQHEKSMSVRQQPRDRYHHHVHHSLAAPNSPFKHFGRDVDPRTKHPLTDSDGGKFNASRRHEESPPLCSPHDRARMFDYSCARLPNEIRKHSSSTSMRPPASTARPPRTSTDYSQNGHRHRHADERRPRMQSTSSSAHGEEHRMYTALHSLYGSDVRDRSAGHREPERVTRAVVKDYERYAHERVKGGMWDRAVAGAAKRLDQSLMQDYTAAPSVHLPRDYNGRTSSAPFDRHATRPIVAMPEAQLRPTVNSPSSCKPCRPSHGPREPALQRHQSIHPGGRSSDGDPHRSGNKMHDHESDRYSSHAPHTPGQRRLLPSRRAQNDPPWSQSARERAYSSRGRAPPALPLPRNASPVASVVHPRRSAQAESHGSSPAQYGKIGRTPDYIRRDGSKVPASSREQWQVQASYEQQNNSMCGSDDPMRFDRQVRKEEHRVPTRGSTDDYMIHRTADLEQNRLSWPAVLHEPIRSSSHHQEPAASVHRTKQVLHRASSGGIPHTSRSSPHSVRSSGNSARHDHQAQLSEVTSHANHSHMLQTAPQPAPRLLPLENPPIIHRSRALPPVIASQHTSLHPTRPSSHEHQHPSAAAMSAPPTRPMKRHRADSDTSLVVKASRFTVMDEPRQADVRDPTCALRSPSRHLCASERDSESRHQRHAEDSGETRDAQRFSGESDAQSKSVNGSAPITPPLSST